MDGRDRKPDHKGRLRGHRQLVVVRGTPAQTRARVRSWLKQLEGIEILWVGANDEDDVDPRRLSSFLGQGFDGVVLDAHGDLDPDALGQAHGLVWGGGVLVIRSRPLGSPRPAGPERLVAWPYLARDVRGRFDRRFEAMLGRHGLDLDAVVAPRRIEAQGTEEQRQHVDRLRQMWSQEAPTRVVLTADRGRGKSSALGLALRAREDEDEPQSRVVTASDPAAAQEALNFAGDVAEFVPLPKLLRDAPRGGVIVVDEAAQLPVPMLRQLVARHVGAHLAFATTTHGYEGTGRGFTLRFVSWLRQAATPVVELELHEPIRWADDDPLEAAVFEALLLDASAADASAVSVSDPLRCARVDRDHLAHDDGMLRELFGLLVQAHYRTTPADLQRILDAPNLQVHAAWISGRIVGATLVAEEGGFDESIAQALVRGQQRPRAHALPDMLGAQLGYQAAAAMVTRRSVRIATVPELRRRGIATALVQHVHDAQPAELWGTLFGATSELIAFRRSVGYEVAALSATRGARTGEPSVVMLRPCSGDARRLLEQLRLDFARELPLRLRLLSADAGTELDPELAQSLARGLRTPEPYRPSDVTRLVRAYADGPRTFESAATAIRSFAETRSLTGLPESMRHVIKGRVMELRSWEDTAQRAGLDNPRVAMRSLRRAIRSLLES